MTHESDVARHYARSDLTATVLDALRRAGADLGTLATADLAGVDEFHTGWGPLTRALAAELAPPPGTRLLDVGSGIGGPARHFAETGAARSPASTGRRPSSSSRTS